MSKIILDIKAEELINLRDGDILMFSETEKCFYRQTPQEFWKLHNEELSRIIKRYDELVKNLEEKEKTFEKNIEKNECEHEEFVKEFIKTHEKHEKEFEEKVKEYLATNKNITSKLIEMVENFIKTGGNL